jgi:4'-phosphopantetheinyl transferase
VERSAEPSGSSSCTVHLWAVDPDDVRDEKLCARYERLLSADELAVLGRYRIEAVRHRHLVSRALLRTVLGRRVGVAPERVAITKTATGRPELASNPGTPSLRFNLSHTEGLIVLGVTDEYTIGVDVEHDDRAVDILGIARRFFAPTEHAALFMQGEPERRRLFFSYWTLKEALLKAQGVGLSEGMDTVQFAIESTRLRTRLPVGEIPDAWALASLELGPRHRGAVAVRVGRPADLVLVARKVVPLVRKKPLAFRVIASSGRCTIAGLDPHSLGHPRTA